MYMLWAGVLIYPQIQVPIEAKRKLWVPGDVAIVSCEPPKVGTGKQEQQVLLKAEPPLQSSLRGFFFGGVGGEEVVVVLFCF